MTFIFNRCTQTEGEEWGNGCPRAHQPNREEVGDAVLQMNPQKAKGSVVGWAAPSRPLSARDLETSNFKLPAFQRLHSDSHSISLSVSLSVSPSLSQYNDSHRLSEVLVPIGYLSRLSHTFIYELGPALSGEGSDWIVRFQFSSITAHLISTCDFLPLSSNRGERRSQSKRCRSVPTSIALSSLEDRPDIQQRAYRLYGCVCLFHSWAFVSICVHTYVCCEDPMAYFARDNLSNERMWEGDRECVGGRQREREKEHWVQIIIQIISSQS